MEHSHEYSWRILRDSISILDDFFSLVIVCFRSNILKPWFFELIIALIISYQLLSNVFLHDTLDHRNCRVAQIFVSHVNSTPSLTFYSELTGEIMSEMKLVARS